MKKLHKLKPTQAKPAEEKTVKPNTTPPKEKLPSMYAQAILSERSKKYDPSITKEEVINDLRDVQLKNPDTYITRNFYRVNGRYSDKTWNSFFGTFHEYRRQAGLELSRQQHLIEKQIAKHASLDVYHQFYETEVRPWIGKYKKEECSKERIKTVIIGADFHDTCADPFVLSVFIDTCKRLQPNVICLNGDVFDLYEFSRFDKDPRQTDLKARYEFVRDHIFRALRNTCPNSQIDLVVGNHEMRILKHLADRSPYMKVLQDLVGVTFSQLLMLDEFEINLVSKLDLKAYKLADIRDEVKNGYAKYYDCLICRHEGDQDFAVSCVGAHTHRPNMTTRTNEAMGPIFRLTVGGICKVDTEYHNGKISAMNSFAICHIDTLTRQVTPEHILFTDDMCCVGGIYYYRKDV